MATVVGYHACSVDFARRLWRNEVTTSDWMPSENEYDWLGSGIYFWGNGLRRAQEWAGEIEERHQQESAVVKATIDLGRCLDLTNTSLRPLIHETYESLKSLHEEEPELGPLPENGGNQLKLRRLDCYVVDQFVQLATNGMPIDDATAVVEYQTVRCSFDEGEALCPGSGILSQTHPQLSVRDNSCIIKIEKDDYRRSPSADEKMARAYCESLSSDKSPIRSERQRLAGREICSDVILFE
ncbi:hypothetical protein [Rosistilla oblonga]|uniref:hypothetical protein n=1 Tax=Rosistilla oblonga TaxID=2527990 RepID=UPI003A9726BE